MGTVQIDEDELRETQYQASQYIPWKAEAERLADALYNINPNHRLLRGEMWEAFVAEKQKVVNNDWGHEPASSEVVEAVGDQRARTDGSNDG